MRAIPAVLLLLAGCPRARDTAEEACPAVETDQPTVPRIAWTPSGPGPSFVEYAFEDQELVTPTVDVEESASFLLAGLPPLMDVTYTAVTEVDGVEERCRGSLTTGGLPSDLPDMHLAVTRPDLWSEGRWLLASVMGAQNALVIVDREARRVWYRQMPPEEIWTDLQVAMHREALVFNTADMQRTADISALRWVALDGTELEEVATPMAHHIFQQLPDGRIAYVAADVRAWVDPDSGEEVTVAGDAFRLLNEDGSITELSSTWDWLEVEKTEPWDDQFYPFAKDWTHANAVQVDPEANRLLVTLANIEAVVELDMGTGQPIRFFGAGDPSAYPVVDGTVIYHPHDGQLTPDGTLLVVTTDAEAEETMGVEYAIDDEEGVLREVWNHGRGFNLASFALGQVRQLENGNVLVNFGSAGAVREVTPEGEVAWEVRTSTGTWFGQVHLVDDLYGGR